MTEAESLLLASFGIMFIVLTVCVNIWSRDVRASMTQAERDEEDKTAERW